MKTKLGSMLLAAAGVLGSVAVAQAQPAPPPDPAPAPPPAAAPAPPPPAADFNTAPAALPAAPPQAPPPNVSWGTPGTPGADSAEAPKKPPKPNPFAFSWFTWTQSASTKIFGVGRDYQGTEDEVYRWDFSLRLRYAVINEQRDTLYVGTSIPWGVELTNSNSTLEKNQTLLGDISLSTGYSHAFVDTDDKEYRLAVGPSVSVALPTSLASQACSQYASTTFGLGARGKVKLAGAKSKWVPSLILIGSGSVSHDFTKSDVCENDKVVVHRQTTQGVSEDSHVLVPGSNGGNTVGLSFTYALPIYTNLSMYNSFSLDFPYTHSFRDDQVCIKTATGCATPNGINNPTTMTPTTGFDISLSYDIFEYGFVGLGYKNNASQLSIGGTRQSLFYSPGAQFYASLTVTMDGIYEKLTTKSEKKTAETKKKTAMEHRLLNF